MYKVLIALFALGLTDGLYADGFEMKGIINNIDDNAKTISVNNVTIQVMPQTHIKLDDCGIFGMDVDGRFVDLKKFVDLKVGSFVEVEAWPNSSVNSNAANSSNNISYVASEIEQKCVSNKAY